MTDIKFKDRVAVVTGAATGLGRAYALELARRGASVVVNNRVKSRASAGSSISPVEKVVEEILSLGGKAVVNFDDVSTRAGGQGVVDTALNSFGRLDILIANAGFLRHARFEEMTDEDIDQMLDVHLKAGFYVGQPAFAAMKQNGYGRILFTSSSSGMFGHPWQSSYGAAKGGIVGLANVVALEGKSHGIFCNVIMPTSRTRLADEIDYGWMEEVPEVATVLGKLFKSIADGGEGSNGMERLNTEWVVPLAIHLVSEQCESTHQLYSAVNGRFSRVFIGATEGWVAKEQPQAEDVAAHWNPICNTSIFHEPQSVYDEAWITRETIDRAFQKEN